ncbi:hypothetical protein ACIBQ1_55570 [Nonomuraea sp. NPDC050153]|uniref:hypothetical protein n=1 Tax=Nonomuraea sp. NPDC050153 TaxID=3364359 RepID=UPI0037882F19
MLVIIPYSLIIAVSMVIDHDANRKAVMSVRTAFVVAALAGASLIATPAAHASVASSAQAALPSCVSIETWFNQKRYVKVTNNCSSTVRAQVIFRAGGSNSSCKSLAPGKGFTHSSRGVYQKTVSC